MKLESEKFKQVAIKSGDGNVVMSFILSNKEAGKLTRKLKRNKGISDLLNEDPENPLKRIFIVDFSKDEIIIEPIKIKTAKDVWEVLCFELENDL